MPSAGHQVWSHADCFVLSMMVFYWMFWSNKDPTPQTPHRNVKHIKGNKKILTTYFSSLQPIMPSVWKLKFRYVFVNKNVILIITKHVLYKECFPDELNYLFCCNVYELLRPSNLFYPFVREKAQGTFWITTNVKSCFCDSDLMDRNKRLRLLCCQFVWNTVPLSCSLWKDLYWTNHAFK